MLLNFVSLDIKSPTKSYYIQPLFSMASFDEDLAFLLSLGLSSSDESILLRFLKGLMVSGLSLGLLLLDDVRLPVGVLNF